MKQILIGIDDTDNATSKGTGHLARQLAAECQRRGMKVLGVTRHQFLVDPRIPYTSHNSGACVAAASDGGEEDADFAFEFVKVRSADGSDPGVCVAEAGRVGEALIRFGRDATRRIVEMDEAFRLAEQADVTLKALGGSGLHILCWNVAGLPIRRAHRHRDLEPSLFCRVHVLERHVS